MLGLLCLLGMVAVIPVAGASHIPGQPCSDCASHKYWPKINGMLKKAKNRSVKWTGTRRNDQLLGHHGSDVLSGRGGSDVLWGDWQGKGQPTTQGDRIFGGAGTDFIYGSHGKNRIYGGPGNDVISVHYGKGFVDCGSGRDIYHVAKSRKKLYRFKNCEKVDYRPESKRGPLKPLN